MGDQLVQTLGVPGRTVRNWSGSCSCVPELYFEPETTEDIRKILASARAKGKTVRVIGSGHSFTGLAMTSGYLVSLRKYNRLIHVDLERRTVKAQGGMTFDTLNESILPEHGLALSIQGTKPEITVAGAIATGTHGTGAKFGTTSTTVQELDLMTSSGEILTISNDENADLLQAARLSLGVLGIILNVTLQCEPAFRLQRKIYPAKLTEVLENVTALADASEHFSFSWVPHTDHVICNKITRTEKNTRPSHTSWLWDVFVGCWLFVALQWLSSLCGFIVPWVHRAFFHLLWKHETDVIDRSDKVVSFYCPAHNSSEWAVPREKIVTVLTELRSWVENSHIPAWYPVDVRFVKRDNVYLSPAYGRDVCYVNVIVYSPFGKALDGRALRAGFEEIVLRSGGRPHWAKVYSKESFTASCSYPEWKTFCDIRQKLDPAGMFLNERFAEIFKK